MRQDLNWMKLIRGLKHLKNKFISISLFYFFLKYSFLLLLMSKIEIFIYHNS